MPQERTILYDGNEISYLLERKSVKNLNLRIHKDCKIYVSANPAVSIGVIDDFVVSKGNYIISAQKKFREMAKYVPQPKHYVSGESFYLFGKGLRLKVEKSDRESISTDGIYLYLKVKNTDDFNKKQKMVIKYFDKKCSNIFGEIMLKIYPVFQKYGVSMPILRIRDMETRWGSCSAKKGIITLNKRLLETPRNCIEYVIMHEFCHFIHPNHSKKFYDFLTMLMPDWKERKMVLERNSEFRL